MGTGVKEVEWTAGEELMTVTGEVDPMKLLNKIHNWGKKAELVSVYNTHDSTTSKSPVLPTPDEETTKKKKKKQQHKCFHLWGLFGKQPRKAKVEPFASSSPARDNRISLFPPMAMMPQPENGSPWSFAHTVPHLQSPPPPPPPPVYPPPQAMHGSPPPAVYPPPQAMQGSPPPLPYPPPYLGMGHQPAPPQHSAGMYRFTPPSSPPYFQSAHQFTPGTANPSGHYPHSGY